MVPRECLPGNLLNPRVADRAGSEWKRQPTCPARPAGGSGQGARQAVSLTVAWLQKGLPEAEKNGRFQAFSGGRRLASSPTPASTVQHVDTHPTSHALDRTRAPLERTVCDRGKAAVDQVPFPAKWSNWGRAGYQTLGPTPASHVGRQEGDPGRWVEPDHHSQSQQQNAGEQVRV